MLFGWQSSLLMHYLGLPYALTACDLALGERDALRCGGLFLAGG
jgi:hypothetical protein